MGGVPRGDRALSLRVAAFVLVLAAAVAFALVAAERLHDGDAGPPPRAQGKLIGVNVHPLWSRVGSGAYDEMLDLVEASGSNVVRVDVGWSSLEPLGPGRWAPAYTRKADAFMRAARERNIGVVVTLAATPCWASSAPDTARQGCAGRWWRRGVTAYPPRDPSEYGRIARAVVRRWGDSLAGLEVWNEPNDRFFFRSLRPARDYGALLRSAYRSVKAELPRLDVVGGSLAYADGAFLERLYENGRIAHHYDAISYHPYTNGVLPASGGIGGGARKLSFRAGGRWIRRVMRGAGDRRPRVWLTEVGASTCPVGPICVSEDRQARYVAQAVRLARRTPAIEAIMVYSLTNDGRDRTNPVNGYGLVDADGRPKPAFAAFRQAAAGR